VAQVGKGLTRATGREEWVNSTSGFFICGEPSVRKPLNNPLTRDFYALGARYTRAEVGGIA